MSISMDAQPPNIKPSKIIIKILIYLYRLLNTCHPVKIPVVPNSQLPPHMLIVTYNKAHELFWRCCPPFNMLHTPNCAQLSHQQLRGRFKEELFTAKPQDATWRPKGIQRMKPQRADCWSEAERLLREKEPSRGQFYKALRQVTLFIHTGWLPLIRCLNRKNLWFWGHPKGQVIFRYIFEAPWKPWSIQP